MTEQVAAEVTVAGLAREASEWFETARRATGDTDTGPREDGERYVRIKDGAPDWLTDLAYEAHGGMGPDDWRYECISAAVDAIADNDGDEDAHEFADGYVDTYTHDRLQWLASNLQRSSYVDDARGQGLITGDEDTVEQIGVGQYMEASEVYSLVYRFLEERVAELEAEDDEDDDELPGSLRDPAGYNPR